ncbi:hypothetical protein M422DRAFT_254348 [Sphaerobolus stellatus SS14]|uniref:Uncharacterized protein n=1 Tax=Sphaerobolus stellatus (strain SS14) TaxID=990650 RepID=A0A0C9V6F7_SPHS4|nr:hypothetical protein M422DRAFT_254348 [Sphaerobolus stellatus SS14]
MSKRSVGGLPHVWSQHTSSGLLYSSQLVTGAPGPVRDLHGLGSALAILGAASSTSALIAVKFSTMIAAVIGLAPVSSGYPMDDSSSAKASRKICMIACSLQVLSLIT